MDVNVLIDRIKRPFDIGPNYDKGRYWDIWHILLCVFAVVLVIINGTRMFDNCFWGDEIYSINASKRSFADIIDYTLHYDANPFLYYMLLRVICLIFGWCPFAYHLSAMLPYIGMLILSVTVIYKTFGKVASFTFMILSTFLVSAVFYIPEVRMYELGAFTMTASFLALYFVLKEGRARHYILFIISTICAGLSHYYCLIAVAFLYLVLMIDLLIREREKVSKKVKIALLSVIVIACCSAPILYERFTKVTGDFWITEYISFKECMLYLFDCGNLSAAILVLATAALIITMARSFLNNDERKKGTWKFIRNIDHESVWVIAGLVSVLGTIGVGLFISKNYTPMLIERYIFPIATVAWLIFAFALSRCDVVKTVKTLLPFAVALCLLIAGAPNYVSMVDEEHSNEVSQNAIMDVTQPYIDAGYIIVTDMNHLNVNVLDYYYPGNTHLYIDNYKVPHLDHSKKYLLYVEYYIHWKISVNLEAQGYITNELIHGKFATVYTLYVYELVPNT